MCKAVNDYARALAEESKVDGKIEKALEYAEINRRTYEEYLEKLQ